MVRERERERERWLSRKKTRESERNGKERKVSLFKLNKVFLSNLTLIICLHTVKWFQLLQLNTNHSI